MSRRILIVLFLGFSSGLPLGLLTGTLQAWYADLHMSVLMTGMLSLINIPYAYRFLWGPLLDRYSFFRLGKRRSWILITQFALLGGFNLLAWLSPENLPYGVAFLAFFLACCSATQDLAIDAHRVEYLAQNEYGIGATVATLGYRLALLITGGVALIVAQNYGWFFTYQIMSLFMLVGIVVCLISPEPSRKCSPVTPLNRRRQFFFPIKEMITWPNVIPLVFFILFYKCAEAFTSTNSGIVMPFLIQGLGFPLDTIAYINKMVGIIAIILGGITAGFILLRYSLFYSLLIFGLLHVFSTLFFIALAVVGKNLMLFATAVVCDNFVAGLSSTALVVLFMRLVNKNYTATQFSFLVGIATLPRIFSGPCAAFLQLCLGWVGMYEFVFFLAIVFVPFLVKIKGLAVFTEKEGETLKGNLEAI